MHPQVRDIVGDFTSVSLLEMDTSLPETFVARAKQVRHQVASDLEHRSFSGVQVLRELARRKGGFDDVLLPVVFTSALPLGAGAGGPDSSAFEQLGEAVYSVSQTPQVWLDHQVLERRGDLIFNWDVVEELFPDCLVDDMFDAYCRRLDALASTEWAWTDPRPELVPVYQLAERTAANATDVPVSDDLLQSGFLRQVALRPQATAVVTPERKLTYAELHREADRLGQYLRKLGVTPNTLVAVVLDKGWQQVVATLGVLLAGAAYLPIDPGLPAARRELLLEQGEVRMAVTDPDLDRSLEWPTRVARVYPTAARDAEWLPPATVSPGDLAYVMYTSGSSGVPKGVAIDHRGAVNTIEDINRRFGVGPADRVLALSSLSFDLSVWDIFGLLAAGGTIVLPAASEVRGPAGGPR